MNVKPHLNRLTAIIMMAVTSLIMTAQEKTFPAAVRTGGMPMNQTVALRHSTREFDKTKEVNDSTLGQLLWMTLGVNRPDAQPSRFGAPANRSNPTARNWQEIRAYVFDKDGVWEYLPSSHTLKLVTGGDHRAMVAGTKEFFQEFVLDAPVSIVLVADMTGLPEGQQTKNMALVDVGIACENLNLACTSEGLATVPRATMDINGISALLNLTPLQLPVINNPVGYAK